MFKVGDKGKTVGGLDYVITEHEPDHVFGNHLYPWWARTSDGNQRSYDDYGVFVVGGDPRNDLLHPYVEETYTQDELDAAAEHETGGACLVCDLAELAQIAANAARDNPDISVTLDPELRVLHFNCH